jgi:hypothetical protein
MTTTVDPAGAVRPERFAAAKTYEAYIASISRNAEKFADNLEKTRIADGQAARLRALVARPDGPAKVLVIGEDWCPDVFRGMPVMKRIAEAAGMEMRVLERDQNVDVMEHFRNNGEFDSIPVFVFYTRDGGYLCHWIERPAKANEEMREAMSPVFGPSGMRALTEKYGRAPTEEERTAAKAEAQQRYEEFQTSSPYWAAWRDYTVQEVLELLERTCGTSG